MTTEQTQEQPETRPSEVRSDALLDCPFCGGHPVLDQPRFVIAGEKRVYCTACGNGTWPGPEYKVIRAWNHRQSNAGGERHE